MPVLAVVASCPYHFPHLVRLSQTLACITSYLVSFIGGSRLWILKGAEHREHTTDDEKHGSCEKKPAAMHPPRCCKLLISSLGWDYVRNRHLCDLSRRSQPSHCCHNHESETTHFNLPTHQIVDRSEPELVKHPPLTKHLQGGHVWRVA